jgi:regulator of replication initiation timing
MEITKKSLIDLIKKIDEQIRKTQSELAAKDKHIQDLTLQNEQLRVSNSQTLDEIREYIKELKKIRNHYVDSNNIPG